MNDTTDTPFADGKPQDGRDPSTGRFVQGNRGGPGNPRAAIVEQFRAEMFGEIKPGEIAAMTRKLIDAAKAGDLDCIKEALDRLVGKPAPADVMAELAELAAQLAELEKRK